MADWTYVPIYSQQLQTEPAPVVISKFEDGYELRRQKYSWFPREWEEKYHVNGSNASGIEIFYRTKGLLTAFTKITYDPREVGNTEALVRFVEPLKFTRIAANLYEFVIRFREVRS